MHLDIMLSHGKTAKVIFSFFRSRMSFVAFLLPALEFDQYSIFIKLTKGNEISWRWVT